jgi:hypothetical protein
MAEEGEVSMDEWNAPGIGAVVREARLVELLGRIRRRLNDAVRRRYAAGDESAEAECRALAARLERLHRLATPGR